MNIDKNRIERRIAIFTLAVILVIGGLACRIWAVSRLFKSDLDARRIKYVDRLRSTPGMAGDILDRNGLPLAIERPDRNGNSTRLYPYAESAAPVTGYVSFNSFVGFERWRIRHDIADNSRLAFLLGDAVFSLGRTQDTQLTIDANLQRECYRTLLSQGCPGSIILMSFDGDILAMVSAPTFDPNRAIGFKGGEYRASLTETVTRNRAVSPIAPGSTIKPLLYLLAKSAGDWPQQFTCEGLHVLAGEKIDCVGAHGRVDWQTAITQSCGPRAAELAANDLTSLAIHDELERIGLGRSDLQGLGPIRASLLDASAPAEQRVYVGKGNAVAIPPISLLRAYIAIGNHGKAPTPHLILGQEPQFERLYSRADADEMAAVLRQVVVSGTARAGRRWNIAGKTGTNRLHANENERQGGLFVWIDVDAQLAGLVILEGTKEQSFKSSDAVRLVDRMYSSFLSKAVSSQPSR